VNQRARGHIVRLVAEVEGQVVANGQLTLLRDKGEIGSLVVAAPYRRRGIGAALVQELIDKARERDVRTLELSAPADTPWIQAWYQRLGFVPQGTHTYPGPERVVILRLELARHDKEARQCPLAKA
jgi:ribosomal protein S18 acetylase RimI-like enzyme